MIVLERPAGDLEPPLALRLTAGGLPIPDATIALADAIEWFIHDAMTNQLLLGPRDAEMFAQAEARLTWQTSDPVEASGLYRVSCRLTFPTLRPQTVPSREADKVLLRVYEP